VGRPAARITDPVAHPLPPVLTPGPGSLNVLIGGLPAWRGVPAAAAAAIQSAKAVSDAAIKAAEAATLAAAGTPGAPAALAAEQATKATAAASMGSMISSMSGGADIHVCATPLPIPPHGPGVIIDGSQTVLINGLPACRQGDTIVEAVGPPNKVAMGLPTVLIGDAGGGGLDAGAGAGAAAGAAAKEAGAGAGAGAASPSAAASLADKRTKTIEQAKSDAKDLLTKCLEGLKKRNDATKARAKKWFGDDDEATLKLMQDRVEKEIKKLDSFTAANFVPAEKGEEDCYAYVYPDKDDKIYLGNDFDTAPATGPDSKAGTLVHEMSHYNSVAGTKDVVMSDGKTAYGRSNCEKLAKDDPAKAKKNADSFEYFVEGD
jgi:uncharacterized Zn-binding protein involved in type VI secretion